MINHGCLILRFRKELCNFLINGGCICIKLSAELIYIAACKYIYIYRQIFLLVALVKVFDSVS